jgi:hypothetical protein
MKFALLKKGRSHLLESAVVVRLSSWLTLSEERARLEKREAGEGIQQYREVGGH